MCLILFAYRVHPQYLLVVAANRDEFFDRPTQAAHFWQDAPQVLAGKDLQAQGTWMGITRQGRFAAVTNFRQGGIPQDKPGSRGDLTRHFLTGEQSSDDYLSGVAAQSDHYNGFNLLTGDIHRLGYLSHQGHRIDDLAPGVYGLSNALLDTPWPKVQSGKSQLASLLATDITAERLFEVLGDTTLAADEQLPETGVGIEFERILSSRFIHSPDGNSSSNNSFNYGTRTSTVLLVDYQQQVTFDERSFDAQRQEIDRQQFQFTLESSPVTQ